MNRARNQSSKINRREFCKAAPWAAITGISFSSLLGMTPEEVKARFSSERPPSEKEETMAKPITAVKAKVKSVKGTCGLGLKVGDVVKFTETEIKGKICIHALYSMLPAVFAMMYDAKFPWLEDPDTKTHACPDAVNPVVFEITRIREG
ncbi:MAG: TIGR04076 family protein [Candidatus Aminicenantes bacterium]|nr:TIGR04076 family protein [Candidatus Aminicenantes bacterium]